MASDENKAYCKARLQKTGRREQMNIKRIIMVGVVMAAMATLAATPTVSNVTAKQRFPWNGLVDIKCTVEGFDNSGEYKFSVKAVNGDSGNVSDTSSVWMIRNGEKSASMTVSANGEYHLLWNAKADLGETVWSNTVMRVTLELGGVQLWENGPYWAEYNVGATKPEDFGYYFWWGDTVGYKRVNDAWVATDGSSSSFSFSSCYTPTYSLDNAALQSFRYIDLPGNLVAKHDAATAHLGAPWCMPTDAEFSALISNCTTTWITTNGVNGRLVTGKGVYANRSIFLPAAGFGDGSGLYDIGSFGNYWSSTPDSGRSGRAWHLYFSSSNLNRLNFYRYYGLSVRPVRGFTE